MAFLCGNTLVKVPLLQAGTVVIWSQMFQRNVKPKTNKQRNRVQWYITLLLRLFSGDISSACLHGQFHTLVPGLLDSGAALSKSYPNTCMQCREAVCTIFMTVFGMTRLGPEPTTYRVRDRHAKQYPNLTRSPDHSKTQTNLNSNCVPGLFVAASTMAEGISMKIALLVINTCQLKVSGPFVETKCAFFCIIKNIIKAGMWAWKSDYNNNFWWRDYFEPNHSHMCLELYHDHSYPCAFLGGAPQSILFFCFRIKKHHLKVLTH